MDENKWDKLLKIKTAGRDDSQSDQYRYPYEPTPYSVLERLGNTGYIRKGNTLLDYGCGDPPKGLWTDPGILLFQAERNPAVFLLSI